MVGICKIQVCIDVKGFKENMLLTEKFIERKKREYEELQKELEILKQDVICK
jgi:hypothetical protein